MTLQQQANGGFYDYGYLTLSYTTLFNINTAIALLLWCKREIYSLLIKEPLNALLNWFDRAWVKVKCELWRAEALQASSVIYTNNFHYLVKQSLVSACSWSHACVQKAIIMSAQSKQVTWRIFKGSCFQDEDLVIFYSKQTRKFKCSFIWDVYKNICKWGKENACQVFQIETVCQLNKLIHLTTLEDCLFSTSNSSCSFVLLHLEKDTFLDLSCEYDLYKVLQQLKLKMGHTLAQTSVFVEEMYATVDRDIVLPCFSFWNILIYLTCLIYCSVVFEPTCNIKPGPNHCKHKPLIFYSFENSLTENFHILHSRPAKPFKPLRYGIHSVVLTIHLQ